MKEQMEMDAKKKNGWSLCQESVACLLYPPLPANDNNNKTNPELLGLLVLGTERIL
jgi:hypothetical protein